MAKSEAYPSPRRQWGGYEAVGGMLSSERRMVRTRGQASSRSAGGEIGLASSTLSHHARPASLVCETSLLLLYLTGWRTIFGRKSSVT